MRKATWLASIPCALLCTGALWAQTAAEDPEEIVVRGQRLSDLRLAVEVARVRVYDLFNDLNSDDAYDVTCHVEDSTGTRIRQHNCRPQFKDDISADVAEAWVHAIRDGCGGTVTQDCMFNPGIGSNAKASAMAVESREPVMQKRFAQEMARAVVASPELQQAILDYEARERTLREAQRARGCDRPDPPARCSR